MTSINTILAQIMELELETVLPMLMLACLGVLLIILALSRLARGKVLLAGMHSIGGLVILCIGVLLIAISLNLHTYQRLSYEQEIARVAFNQISPKKYNVSINFSYRDEQQEFIIEGDEWQMDARILRWTPKAQLLGLNAQYRLERLSGRYQDLDLERSSTHTVYSLSNNAGLDLWTLAKRYKNWLPWIDAYYGNAVYLPMIDSGNFAVSINQNGLIARPINKISEEKVIKWK